MRKLVVILSVVLVLFVVFVALGPFYILQEGEQAAVTRFGELVKTETEAGLKLKMPMVDSVIKFPHKILSWDGDPQRLPTSENQFIWVDTTARWKITDLNKFYESITNVDRAYSRLDDVIDSSVRNIIANNPLLESVRNSNLIIELSQDKKEEEAAAQEEASAAALLEGIELSDPQNLAAISQKPVEKGRMALSDKMLETVSPITESQFGIEVIDIVIRQIRYSEDLTESVYSRMITERKQIAEQYRSEGQGKKQKILGQLERRQDEILSEAYEEAETIKGEGDAQAAAIYADAYSRDPQFTEFWLALESYKKTMKNFDKTLTTDMDYFQYLYSPDGR